VHVPFVCAVNIRRSPSAERLAMAITVRRFNRRGARGTSPIRAQRTPDPPDRGPTTLSPMGVRSPVRSMCTDATIPHTLGVGDHACSRSYASAA